MEFEVMAKDYIKFYFLNEVVYTGTTEFNIYFESEGCEKNFTEVRKDSGIYRVNNFNVTEDMSRHSITFRPIVIGGYAYFNIKGVTPVKVEVVLNGTNTVSRHFTLRVGESRLIFEPQETKRYMVKVDESNIQTDNEPAGWETDESSPNRQKVHQLDLEEVEKCDELRGGIATLSSEVSDINSELEELRGKHRQLNENKNGLIKQLQKLEAEYEKDYSEYEKEIEEIRARYDIDKEILRYYAGNDMAPVETLLAQANEAIWKLEEQIRLFVQAKQKKTAEIENELKIGKKD